MDFKNIVCCCKCGLLFDISQLQVETPLQEGESVFSEKTKLKYSKMGVCFTELFGQNIYFFCPVCETLNEVEQ
jgi:hypothetical protein